MASNPTPPKDYSGMSDAEINREIAERKGWKVVNGFWYPNDWNGKFDAPNFMLNWSGDINAAMELAKGFVAGDIRQRGADIRCRITGDSPPLWNAEFTQLVPFEAIEWLGQDTRPARAICIAYLLWKDATEPKGASR